MQTHYYPLLHSLIHFLIHPSHNTFNINFFACSYPRNLYNLFMIIIIVIFIIIAIIITIVVFIIAVNIIIVAGRLFRLIKFFFTIAKFSCFTHQLLKKAQFSNDHSCKIYFTKSKKKTKNCLYLGQSC